MFAVEKDFGLTQHKNEGLCLQYFWKSFILK